MKTRNISTKLTIILNSLRSAQINSPSDGTLSSYGYVLMLMHFLQTRQTPLIPNLQKTPEKEGCKCFTMLKHPNESDLAVNSYFYKPNNDEMWLLLRKYGKKNTQVRERRASNSNAYLPTQTLTQKQPTQFVKNQNQIKSNFLHRASDCC